MKAQNRRFENGHRRNFVEILDKCQEYGGDRAASLLLSLSPEEWKPLVQAAVETGFAVLRHPGTRVGHRKILEARLERGWTRAAVVLKAKGAFDELALHKWEYDRRTPNPALEVQVLLERIYSPAKIDELFANSSAT